MADDKAIKLGVNRDYARNVNEWQEIQDLLDGKHEVLVSDHYLWKHEFETKAEGAQIRGMRQQRSRYTNCMEIVVSTWVSLVLKKDFIIPESVKSIFTDVGLKDVDGEGNDLKTFLREKVAPIYFGLGNVHIVTNAPAISVANRKEENIGGIKPFWTALSPLNIKDWMFDSAVPSMKKYRDIRWDYIGDGDRASIEEPHVEFMHSQRFAVIDGQVVDVRYRATTPHVQGSMPPTEWDRKSITQLEGFSEIPVAFVESDTWLRGVKEQQLRLFNLESALDNQIISQAFQRIFITGITSEKAKITLHEYVINFLPEGATVTIAEPSNPVSLERRILSVITMLFKVAFNHQFTIAEGSKEAPGADSTAAMKAEMISLALNAIDDLELLLNRAVRHYAMFKKVKDVDKIEQIKLSREITEQDVQTVITLATSVFQQMLKSKTWIREYLKTIARRMPLNNIEQIEAEIDALEFEAPDLKKMFKDKLSDKPDPTSIPG